MVHASTFDRKRFSFHLHTLLSRDIVSTTILSFLRIGRRRDRQRIILSSELREQSLECRLKHQQSYLTCHEIRLGGGKHVRGTAGVIPSSNQARQRARDPAARNASRTFIRTASSSSFAAASAEAEVVVAGRRRRIRVIDSIGPVTTVISFSPPMPP